MVFSLDEALGAICLKIGNDLPDYNGDDTREIPVPATYVIDPAGIITYSYVNIDYTQRVEPADIVEVLAKLKKIVV